MEDILLGIDLGTTYSVAAFVNESGIPVLIENSEGKALTPSVVLIEDGDVTVGEPALNQAILKKDKVIRWIKRDIGDDEYRFQGLNPVEISAEILKKLKMDAELFLSQSLSKAVITCPAYFAAHEVTNTRRAGEIAGFEVMEIVREPVAAAIYYGIQHLNDGEKVLVYDLGGGTFDATVLELRDDVYRPLATLGDRYLGGHDWTSDLLAYVSEELSRTLGVDPRDDPVVYQTLYERCESAKRDLVRLEAVTILCHVQGRACQVEVPRQTFEELTEGYIERTIEVCQSVLTKADPSLTWDEIAKILLVGGSTRLRRVSEALIETTGITPVRTGEVDTMVALGAAILAKGSVRSRHAIMAVGHDVSGHTQITPVLVERRCPRHLGTRVLAWKNGKPEVVNSVIIPYGSLLPAEETRGDYAIGYAGQPFFDVPIIEFDEYGEDVILETYRFSCRSDAAPGTGIAVTFIYNQSGEIKVNARDLTSGELLRDELVKYQEPDLNKVEHLVRRRDLIFALDISGSMAGDKLEDAKRALLETAEKLYQGGGGMFRAGIVTFGSEANSVCSLTYSIEDLRQAIGPVSVSGSTKMNEGIKRATAILLGSGEEAMREIAMVTDGMPDDQSSTLAAAENAKKAGIRISAAGINSHDVDEAFLRRFAENVQIVASAGQLSQALPNLLMQSGSEKRTAITWGTP